MGDRWIKTREAEIILHAPGFWSIAVSKFVPKSFTNLLCVGNYDAENLAAADQSVVPAEVVIEDEFEAFGLFSFERIECETLRFRFQTTATECAGDFSIGMKHGFRARLPSQVNENWHPVRRSAP